MVNAGGGETRNIIRGGIFFSAVIQGRDITVQLPPEVTRALSWLPPGTAAFTGRDTELSTLLDILAPRSDGGNDDLMAPRAPPAPAIVVAAVGGLAGIGKTELAIQAAHAALHRGWFPGGVLFADLLGYDPARSLDPGSVLEGFLHALGIPGEHIPPQTQDRTRLYASVLAAYAREGRRILVVIDNAATHEQAKPLLPAEPTSAAIVTSRDSLGMLGAQLLKLDILTPEKATHMLDLGLRVARPSDTRVTNDPDHAARIAELCKGLPLALRIIAALLSENPHRPLDEMARDLDDERARLHELSYGDITVRAAFELSYQRLHPDLKRLFRLFTINPGPEISTTATAVVADVDQRAARRGLEALARAHLIDQGSSYGRWQMHDLLRLYAQELSEAYADTDGQQQALERLLRYYLENAVAATEHLRALPGMPVPADFTGRDSALAWLDAERPNLVTAVTMAASADWDLVAMLLPLSLHEYMFLRRYFNDQLTIATVSRDVARRLGEPYCEAAALNSRGNALLEVRRFEEAIAALQDAGAICREIGDRHGEAIAMANLGIALAEMRRFEEAITAHQDATTIFRETGDRHGEGNALVGLGIAFAEMRRFEEAITAHQDAMAILRETGDRHGEVLAQHNLGIALAGMRRFEEAITATQEDLAICRETGDRHGEAVALHNIGIALRKMRQFEEAITAQQEAAAICRETGDRHLEAGVLDSLGIALAEVRRFEEAITAHRDSAAIFRETGDRHGEAGTLDSLGTTLTAVRRFEEAITAHQDAAAIFRKTGDRHGEGNTLDNLGVALEEAGRFEEAITAHQDAMAIFRETGDRHLEGFARNNLGVILRKMHRFEESITALQDAMAIFRETGDRRSEGMALDNLGVALAEVGRFEEAITAQQEAAVTFREVGDRHGEGIALHNLGLAHAEAGRFEQAITALQDAMAIFRETGDRHMENNARNTLQRLDQNAQQT